MQGADKFSLFLKLGDKTVSKIVCIISATGINTAPVGPDNILESCLGHFQTCSTRQIKNAEGELKKKKSLVFCIVLRDNNY